MDAVKEALAELPAEKELQDKAQRAAEARHGQCEKTPP